MSKTEETYCRGLLPLPGFFAVNAMRSHRWKRRFATQKLFATNPQFFLRQLLFQV
ncbi:MAG: hypothetical protein ACM37W_25870 [Actinomycetota bacterium]